jgi:hypothetical protein
MENDKMKIHIQITSDDGTIYHGDAVLQKHGAKVKRPVVESSSKPPSHKCPDIIALLWQNFLHAMEAGGHIPGNKNILFNN